MQALLFDLKSYLKLGMQIISFGMLPPSMSAVPLNLNFINWLLYSLEPFQASQKPELKIGPPQ